MLYNSELGKRIKDARERKKLTQEQLAEQLCVTKQAVSNWERGKNLIDEFIRARLEEILEIDLTLQKRKEKSEMDITPIEQIDNLDELMQISKQIVANTPVDEAFSSSVNKLLELTLNLILGYEIYGTYAERMEWKKEKEADPKKNYAVITTIDWHIIAEDLSSIIETGDYYPIQNREIIIDPDVLYKAKIRFFKDRVGIQIFEEYFKEGFIYEVGNMADSDGDDLLSLLPYIDNAILTSYKISLLQMAEIVDRLED